MAKQRWRWVTRDEGSDFVFVWLSGKVMPENNDYGCFYGAGLYEEFCINQFAAVTGIRPSQSQCLKIDFTAKIIK